MKKSFLILILLPIFGFSQIRNRLNYTDLKRHELKGNVKEMVFKEYGAKFSNDSTYTLELYNYILPSNFKVEFNEYGNLKAKSYLRTENDLLKVQEFSNYKYDNKNRILKEQWFDLRNSKAPYLTLNYEYVGDSVVNILEINKKNKVKYTYLQKGNSEFLNCSSLDDFYATKKLNIYDKFNRVIRSEEYKNKDFIQDFKITTYKDTISLNKFKEVVIETKHNRSFYTKYEYNENKNSIKMIIGNFNNNDNTIIRYEYDYDNNGNWIEKRRFVSRGKLGSVIKREIKYYE